MSGVRSGEKLLTPVVGNNMKERRFWGVFRPKKKRSVSLKLVMISSVSLSLAAMLGNGCQGLELRERRWSHGGVSVLWWCKLHTKRERERERERERWTFWFCKKQETVGLWIFQGQFHLFNLNDSVYWCVSFGIDVNFLLGLETLDVEVEFLKHHILSPKEN